MLLKKSRSRVPKFRLQNLFKPWQQTDLLLWSLPIGLTVFGGVMIRSTELNQGLTDWWWHWLIGGIGLILALLISRSRYENLLQWHWITYALTNFSLVAVMVAGHSAKGAQRWINVAGFNLQPSEFAKIGLIITLAALLEKNTASKIENVFRALAFTAIPWLLVFIQPDLATSLVFGAIVLGMLYWANANPGWLLLFVSPVVATILDNIYKPGWIVWSIAMGFVGWWCLPWRRFGLGALGSFGLNIMGGELGAFAWNHILKEYQKDRITSFMNPDADALGTGYHLIQSRIAIGAGQIWGWGLNKGPMTQLNFVPEQHTDFIYSAVGEEFGFIGSVGIILVFIAISWRLLHIARTAKDNFGSLLAIGVFSMIVFHLIVNVGMNVGLAPVAGIPLPWMSYGRSAMLKNFIAIGLVESVANFRPRQKY